MSWWPPWPGGGHRGGHRGLRQLVAPVAPVALKKGHQGGHQATRRFCPDLVDPASSMRGEASLRCLVVRGKAAAGRRGEGCD